MKTVTQGNAALDHIAALIEDIPVAMCTTLDPNGTLVSRPMAALQMDNQSAIWFFTDLRTSKVAHLDEVNLSFTDASKGTYVSLSGRGVIDTDPDRIDSLWTAFAKPWFPEGPDSPNLALLKFVPDAADYWDSPNNTMVRAFGTSASMVAGQPMAMGEHDSHTGLSLAAMQASAPVHQPASKAFGAF